ncbi:MAG: tRNA pseudouridine(55) synthase TruB [Christensenellales bacterium]
MNGVINFLKPPAMSSNGAVVFLRGLLGVKKTGHAGTLDPGACGVLPVCVGKATRISSYLMDGEKEYTAQVTFGKSTDTKDSYGNVVCVSNAPFPKAKDVGEALSGFRGSITQQTPGYSAVKHNGQKLYKLARRGMEVPVKKREVEIYSARYIKQTDENSHIIRIVCGKGTYIRTLCEDLGQSLGVPAYMSLLVRTRCAGLDISQSVTADELKLMEGSYFKALLPAEFFLDKLQRVDTDKADRRLLINGAPVAADQKDIPEASIYCGGEFAGIGFVRGGMAKITVLLADE